jgi:ribonuclease HI
MTCSIIFTDGSCHPNKATKDARAGYAAVFASGPFKDTVLYGSIDVSEHFASNQRAEGMAVYKTLLYLADRPGWNKAIIVSDSDFWIKMFLVYMPNWSADKFGEKKNPDLTRPMYALFRKMTDSGKIIEFSHVKSHDKNGWSTRPKDSYEYFCYLNNERADKQANIARTTLAPGTDKV